MATLARDAIRNRSMAVNDRFTVTDDQAWGAFERRDRAWDGRIIGAVKTTGIYCRPSCPARRPTAAPPDRSNGRFERRLLERPQPAIAAAWAEGRLAPA